ncbi:hypothetical protein F5Y16DRAFT_364740 [Xylariaceae sp. FL0255]|nr:hypothetical protein F5Y16DRAFT_364740 [Xylariaceae sp. FL0255]
MLASCDDLSDHLDKIEQKATDPIRHALNRIRRIGNVPAAKAFKSFPRSIDGPLVALEYLENGSLTQFYERLKNVNWMLPNRLLIPIVVCMVRALIGIEYPMDGPEGGPLKTETINTNVVPTNFSHNDQGFRNMMWDNASDLTEHRHGQITKIIDFGLMAQSQLPTFGPKQNLMGMARIIASLITGGNFIGTLYQIPGPNPWSTYGGGIYPGGPNGDPLPWYYAPLRIFLCRCMATDPAFVPSLAEALTITRGWLNLGPDAFLDPARETDGSIEYVMQRLIFDA